MPLILELEGKFNEIVSSTIEAKKVFIKLVQLRFEIRQAIIRIKTFVDKTTPADIKAKDFDIKDQKSRETIINRAIKITQKHLRSAIKQAPEYSNPLLLVGLEAVVQDRNLYKILRSGRVEIQMSNYAGTLEEYAEAVKSIRREAGYDDAAGLHTHMATVETKGVFRKKKITEKVTPVERSQHWAKFVAPRGTKLKQQILERRNAFGAGYAPYWELLEKGNTAAAMSSNLGLGAFATPTNKPTHFIENSEKEINAYVGKISGKEFKQSGQEFFTKEDLERINNLLETIEVLIKNAQAAAAEGPGGTGGEGYLDPPKFKKFIHDLNEHYNLIKIRFDAINDKIAQVRTKSVPITRTRTITLGYRLGDDDVLRRVRIRLTTLENLLRGRQ